MERTAGTLHQGSIASLDPRYRRQLSMNGGKRPETILSFSLRIRNSIPLLPLNWNKAILPPFLHVFLCIFMILVFIICKFAQLEMESEYAG